MSFNVKLMPYTNETKQKLKMDHGLYCKTLNYNASIKIGNKSSGFMAQQRILRLDTKIQSIKAKMDKLDLIKF